MKAGKWEKNRFLGVEIAGKTLGVIGCGNIGSIVADRAIGLRMRVVAYDPYLSGERAIELGVEKVDLDELFRRGNFQLAAARLLTHSIYRLGARAIRNDGSVSLSRWAVPFVLPLCALVQLTYGQIGRLSKDGSLCLGYVALATRVS